LLSVVLLGKVSIYGLALAVEMMQEGIQIFAPDR